MTQVPAITAQVGDEIELLVQFVDSAGAIISLAGGSNLFIKLEYPDGTTQDFGASLFTDGTDGIIAYTTGTSDLNQVGYYFIQGKATVGGATFSTRNNQINNALYIYQNVDDA
jgi:xanthine/uracil/vitamin C permease (AzgA family)